MINFNFNDFIFFIYNLFFPAVRIISLFSAAPLLNSRLIDKKIKIVMAFCISWAFSSFLPKTDIVLLSFDGILVCLEQIFIGMLLGFTMQVMFSSIFLSGEIISTQMGLSFSSLFDTNIRSNMSILSRFFYAFSLLLFLEFNGHIWMMSALFDTFITIPIEKINFSSVIFFKIISFCKYIFLDSIILLFPIIFIQLLLNLSMGILSRMSPQISIFSIGFTVSLLVGIVTLYLFIPIFPSYFLVLVHRLQDFVSILFKLS